MVLGKLFKGKSEVKKGQKLRPVINRSTGAERAYAIDMDDREAAKAVLEEAKDYETRSMYGDESSETEAAVSDSYAPETNIAAEEPMAGTDDDVDVATDATENVEALEPEMVDEQIVADDEPAYDIANADDAMPQDDVFNEEDVDDEPAYDLADVDDAMPQDDVFNEEDVDEEPAYDLADVDDAMPQDDVFDEEDVDDEPVYDVADAAMPQDDVFEEEDVDEESAYDITDADDAMPQDDVSEEDGVADSAEKVETAGINEPAPEKNVVSPKNQPVPEQAVRTKLINMIYNTVCKGSQTQRGVHVETALSSLGAMAGFGCQMAVREGMIKPGLIDESEAFEVMETGDGDIYYYGEMLNQPLMEASVSVYGLISEGIKQAGFNEYPDMEAIVAHVTASLGGETFGILTVPPKHQPLITPEASLKRFWPLLFEHIQPYYLNKTVVMVEPAMLGWLFAEATKRLIVEAKSLIEPPLAGRMAFEAAVCMSGIDYRKIMPDYV